MTDRQVLRTRDNLEMMRRPHLWPQGLILPLKHDELHDSGSRRIGILVFNGSRYSWLENASLCDPDSWGSKPPVPTEGDELLVRLVDEGWMVD